MRRVRLLRILAPLVNGVDLSAFRVGDVILVAETAARMLIQEGWAELVAEPIPPPQPSPQRISVE
jgi:hypothetical protein